MDMLYPYFLTIHLICAIIFLGFIFVDVVLLTPIRKILGDEFANQMWSVISKRGGKIMPFCLLVLVLSGGAMISRYIGSEIGYWNTTLQQLLALKAFLALLIFFAVLVSLTFHYLLKKSNPLAKIIHPLALILGLFIVILAKFAFYL
ncbi:copper resistance protein CopD [Helicobacter pullorum]|uniref:copper resistance protein CopD n=1 Tax=Helicobacter pullorum TaxID=35818 RepID=UPI001D7C015A|nr:copper resistance protein CopD [Helicobacter pullorum]HJF83985.1 copper resistance protein CopD [Helicobacter pullorum]